MVYACLRPGARHPVDTITSIIMPFESLVIGAKRDERIWWRFESPQWRLSCSLSYPIQTTRAREDIYSSGCNRLSTPGDQLPENIYLYSLALWAKRTIKTIQDVSRHVVVIALSWSFVLFLALTGRENATHPYDMHTKGDPPLTDRRPPWRRSPRSCDSTTVTVLLANGKVQPSRASERIKAV